METKVYFVGAGPGDPGLITKKGKRLLNEADVIIYAGSLVNPSLVEGLKAELYNSAKMSLEEIIEVITEAVFQGKTVVRLHSGDPAFYGAIHEQIVELKARGIAYKVIPGVTSASAGAASLGLEFTVPEVSQTVIFTRLGGKTPGPSSEDLIYFARKDVTLVIFLSINRAREIEQALLKKLAPDTPIALVYKASWPEEQIIRGKLKDLSHLVKEAGFKKTALIYVGEALEAAIKHMNKRSKLYRDSRLSENFG
ncbi:precorrin-4 C11-methyltransferase [Thermodesulfatator indicus DSM 15286]|uniref:Precorrin-4 C11-methyltransferase n=1 Tax=Thermodesulfatator indicus (strain DSM 15286 / JCM 11887 / CIR29812) TaxID=667014 RepID=F8A9R2_THEID|nr:precorrin-4 C(11)-methyltransferase [Thermodesulfatator indicus]AEH45753.1 precorrin-4 C11-methyltransferase [Thermodesulfatator indicus DSM 15286]